MVKEEAMVNGGGVHYAHLSLIHFLLLICCNNKIVYKFKSEYVVLTVSGSSLR